MDVAGAGPLQDYPDVTASEDEKYALEQFDAATGRL
jgi:hypothetical protein